MVFPGFAAIQGFFWATQGRELSAAMRIIWSFIFSVPIFFALHGASRHVLQLSSNSLLSPEEVSASPADAPIWFLISLYAGALLGGYLAGLVWGQQLFDTPLRKVGLDLRRHRDVVTQALDQRAYLDIKSADGSLIRGWPLLYSNEDVTKRFIYLIRAKRKLDDQSWSLFRAKRKLENQPWSAEGDILLPVDQIRRIYVLDPERPLPRPPHTTLNSSSDT